MPDGELDRTELEQLLAALQGQIRDLEGRIVDLEQRSASASIQVSPAPPQPARQPVAPPPVAPPPVAPPPVAPPPVAPRLVAPPAGPNPNDPWRDATFESPPPAYQQWPQQWPRPQPTPPAAPAGAMPKSENRSIHPAGGPAPAGGATAPWQPIADVIQPGPRAGRRRTVPAGHSDTAAAASTGHSRTVAAAPTGPSLSEELGTSLASLRDLESRITGRLLAWVGAAAVLLGSVFFLSLAFSRGWIGPEGRVALGIVAGTACGEAGLLLLGRRQWQLGHVMVALGLAIASLSLFAGTRYYDLYPPEWALAGSFLAAVAAAVVAMRVNSQSIAVYGLLAIAAAPPIMGAGANAVTIAFLAVTVVGTTAISLNRSWRWLPPAAFLITAPQLIYWLAAKPDAGLALPAIAGYWLLHAVASSADELRERTSASVAVAGRAESLFLANSVLAAAGGLWVLSGDGAGWQGVFMAGVALAHFAFGAYIVFRRGELNPFGLFVNAIGATAVAIAIERQFDGAAVVIGWSVEATLLAAVFGLRRNVYAGGAAALLGAIEIAHFCTFEYDWLAWSLQGHSGSGPVPFADPAGIALAGLLIAGFLAAWMSESQKIRLGLLVAGIALSAYSLPFELSGPALVAAWAIEAGALVALWPYRRVDYLAVVGVCVGGLAVAHLAAFEYPLARWTLEGSAGTGILPFANSSGLALGALLATSFVSGWLSRNREIGLSLLVVGSFVLAYAIPFELSGPALVGAWCAEILGLVAIWRFRSTVAVAVTVAVPAGSVAAMVLANVLAWQYPIHHLSLYGINGSGSIPFADSAALTVAIALVTALLVGVLVRSHALRCGLATGALFVAAYVLPFEIAGVALAGGWLALMPGSIAAEGLLDRLPGRPESRARLRRVAVIEMSEVNWPDAPLFSAALAAGLAIGHMLAYELPVSTLGATALPVTPFVDIAALSGALGIAAFLAAAAITARPDVRVAGILAAAALAAYTVVFELSPAYAVVAWCALAVGLGVWAVRRTYGGTAYMLSAAVCVGLGIGAILGVVVPIQRLGVQWGVVRTGPWFAVDAIVSIGSVAAVLFLASRNMKWPRYARSALELMAGVGLVYLASALVVDFFQARQSGSIAVEELQKQAQVSLSILWGAIGMVVFIAGTIGWRQGVREGGLGLLTLATVKVFLFDLSYLDVSYRVLSLVGLGLLLLVAAFLYQSLRPRRPGAEPVSDSDSG